VGRDKLRFCRSFKSLACVHHDFKNIYRQLEIVPRKRVINARANKLTLGDRPPRVLLGSSCLAKAVG
jgi:hypothetical protein